MSHSQDTQEPSVSITPVETRIWIENDLFGNKAVMVQHESCDQPFEYATFHYDYLYTHNAAVDSAARALALSLGAVEPIAERFRPLETRSVASIRAQIQLLEMELAMAERHSPLLDGPAPEPG